MRWRSRQSMPCLAAMAAVGVVACASVGDRIAGVIVTAVPDEVAACAPRGTVTTVSPESGRNSALDQLRRQALDAGANTVLVASYATATTGIAYRCSPALPQDGHPVGDWGPASQGSKSP